MKAKLAKLTNKIIKEFNKPITANNLTLNRVKTELVYLNRTHTGNLPTEDT